jgi:hypothetical protein
MATLIAGKSLRTIGFGIKVDKATAALPQTTTGTLFTVSGGRVLLTGIVGEVTTIVQAQANNTKLVSTPTVGTAVDLCAVLDITGDEAGCLYGITGVFGDAMVGANAGATYLQLRPIVIPVGTIKLSCAASNTGSVKWSMTYIPLDDAGAVA